MKNGQMWAIVAGFVVALAGTAAASAYLTKQSVEGTSVAASRPHVTRTASDVRWDDTHSTNTVRTTAARPAPACNDGNIVGKAVGGIGGGVLGSAAGKGHGKTATTIAGTLGGAYLGGEMIPTQNVTCPR